MLKESKLERKFNICGFLFISNCANFLFNETCLNFLILGKKVSGEWDLDKNLLEDGGEGRIHVRLGTTVARSQLGVGIVQLKGEKAGQLQEIQV